MASTTKATDKSPAGTDAPKDLVQSVARALNIVDVIAAAKEPMRAQSIASAVNLHIATTSHLLATLVHAGYLERNERTYKLAAGKMLDLSSRVEEDWRPSPFALSLLHQVVEATGESAYLSAWQGSTVTVVAVEEGSHAVRVADLRVGVSGDIHARASGKALLAFGPESQLDRLRSVNGELARRTDHTIAALPDFLADLELTRSRGYALDHQEYVAGVCAMAVPIFEGSQRPRTALSITVPLHRFTNEEYFQRCLDALMEARRLDDEEGGSSQA
ncbi:IclR family transcriptional regulator [Paenarthrobacter sp. FR1]|uniref:IclR family transcriptional regulator n=1 Tax=Paenarthrobacter sp. FR1 TaxID=3439548 RepID=UPI003DA2C80D